MLSRVAIQPRHGSHNRRQNGCIKFEHAFVLLHIAAYLMISGVCLLCECLKRKLLEFPDLSGCVLKPTFPPPLFSFRDLAYVHAYTLYWENHRNHLKNLNTRIPYLPLKYLSCNNSYSNNSNNNNNNIIIFHISSKMSTWSTLSQRTFNRIKR